MRSLLVTSLLFAQLHAVPLEIRFDSPPQSKADTWKQDSITLTREVFASKPGEAIVVRIPADQSGKVSGTLGRTEP